MQEWCVFFRAMPKPPELAGPWSLLVLALLAAVVFVPPVWDAQFLNFDDNLFFEEGTGTVFEQVWDDGDVGALVDPRRTIANAYLPVSHVSLYLDYAARRLLGGEATLARLHSLLLHVLAAFVLARLLGRLGMAVAPATAAAAVFLVHPALVRIGLLGQQSQGCVVGTLRVPLLVGGGRVRSRAAAGGVRRSGALGTSSALFQGHGRGPAAARTAGPCSWRDHARSGRGAGRPVLAVGAVTVLAGLHHTAIAAAEGTMGGGAAEVVADRLVRVPGVAAHYLQTLVWAHGAQCPLSRSRYSRTLCGVCCSGRAGSRGRCRGRALRPAAPTAGGGGPVDGRARAAAVQHGLAGLLDRRGRPLPVFGRAVGGAGARRGGSVAACRRRGGVVGGDPVRLAVGRAARATSARVRRCGRAVSP